MDEVLNALHVPDDAGEYAAGLNRLLQRIPDGWGRWISCSRGWYPIIIELDEQLSALFPGYALHQVKEKFGGLRFYWAADERVTDPSDPEPARPSVHSGITGIAKDAAWSKWEARHDAWCQRLDTYLESPEGAAADAALEQRFKLAEELVDAAERRASVTCELCGEPGQLCVRSHWYRTVCGECAQRHGYRPTR